jgi:hypothetical protein
MFYGIRSKDGFDVTVDELYITRTYLGLFEGCPEPEEWLKGKVSYARKRTNLSLHVLQPDTDVDSLDPNCRWLPSIMVLAEMTSDPVEDDWIASGLSVLWFENEIENVSVRQLIANAIGRVQWALFAKEFVP